MQVKRVRLFRGLLGAAAFAAGLGLSAGARAAAFNVHRDPLPATGLNASFNKSTFAYMYLEGETSAQSASGPDTYVNSADASKTFFRTSAVDGTGKAVTFGAGGVYDGARYATYGSDTATLPNVNSYWQNGSAILAAGAFDVFIRAYPSANGTQTFTLYTGADLASVNGGAAVVAGTVTTPQSASPSATWYKLGTVNLAANTNTFRLRGDTSSSTLRYDTIFFAATAAPEPASLALVGLGAGWLLRRRRRIGV